VVIAPRREANEVQYFITESRHFLAELTER
jgi:hypothetical protein